MYELIYCSIGRKLWVSLIPTFVRNKSGIILNISRAKIILPVSYFLCYCRFWVNQNVIYLPQPTIEMPLPRRHKLSHYQVLISEIAWWGMLFFFWPNPIENIRQKLSYLLCPYQQISPWNSVMGSFSFDKLVSQDKITILWGIWLFPLPPTPHLGKFQFQQSQFWVLAIRVEQDCCLCEWEQREFNSVGQPRKDRKIIDQKSVGDSILHSCGWVNALECMYILLPLPQPATPHLSWQGFSLVSAGARCDCSG